jgi:hypothetical protein
LRWSGARNSPKSFAIIARIRMRLGDLGSLGHL